MKNKLRDNEKNLPPPKKRKVQKSLYGYDFYKSIGSPRFMVAPMVNVSDSAYRLLCKRYGADLCFTAMLMAKDFNDGNEGEKWFSTINGDYPLILQVAGNDNDEINRCVKKCLEIETSLLNAGRINQRNLVAIDLNLGCPQKIARKRNIGSFMMDDQKLVERVLSRMCLSSEIPLPVTCKIRIFPEWEATKTYVRMLVNTGISMLSVHGRTRKQMGNGVADVDVMRRIKEEVVEIPVIANGSMASLDDVERVLRHTKCDGAMVATAMVDNVRLFSAKKQKMNFGSQNDFYDRVSAMREYFEIVEQNGIPSDFNVRVMKNRTFKYFVKELNDDLDVKRMVGRARQIDDVKNVMRLLVENEKKKM